MLRLEPHIYVDRQSGKKEVEKVYGERALALLYGPLRWLAPLIAHVSLFSKFYGWLQRRPGSRKKIAPFCAAYDIEPQEHESFNAFFIRKIERPISDTPAIIPADGRYWVCPDVTECEHFYVKGQKLSITELFGEERAGALVLARLCPTDCHRFLFPVDGTPSKPHLINGPLYSVNAAFLKRNLGVLTQNKRFVTRIQTETFGEVLMVEIGATNVGSVHQTYTTPIHKGMEKGYFSFGGSAIALLFERITFADDLVHNSAQYFETRCLMGQSLSK